MTIYRSRARVEGEAAYTLFTAHVINPHTQKCRMRCTAAPCRPASAAVNRLAELGLILMEFRHDRISAVRPTSARLAASIRPSTWPIPSNRVIRQGRYAPRRGIRARPGLLARLAALLASA